MGSLKREVDRKDEQRDNKIQTEKAMRMLSNQVAAEKEQMAQQQAIPGIGAPMAPEPQYNINDAANSIIDNGLQSQAPVADPLMANIQETAAAQQMRQEEIPAPMGQTDASKLEQIDAATAPQSDAAKVEQIDAAMGAEQAVAEQRAAADARGAARTPMPGIGAPMAQPGVNEALAKAQAQKQANQQGDPAQAQAVQAVQQGGMQAAGQPVAPTDVAAAPPKQYSPEEIKERKIDIGMDQADAFHQSTATDKQQADYQLLQNAMDGTNETDRMAPQVADTESEKLMREILDNKMTTEDAMARYEDKVKKSPWYKDNRLWGAVIAFGLSRLAGADPQTGMVIAGITAGNINASNTQFYKDAEITRAADFKSIREHNNKLLKTGYDHFKGIEDDERDRGREIEDRDDERIYNRADEDEQRAYDEKISAREYAREAEQNALDRAAVKARASAGDLKAQKKLDATNTQIEQGSQMLLSLTSDIRADLLETTDAMYGPFDNNSFVKTLHSAAESDTSKRRAKLKDILAEYELRLTDEFLKGGGQITEGERDIVKQITNIIATAPDKKTAMELIDNQIARMLRNRAIRLGTYNPGSDDAKPSSANTTAKDGNSGVTNGKAWRKK